MCLPIIVITTTCCCVGHKIGEERINGKDRLEPCAVRFECIFNISALCIRTDIRAVKTNVLTLPIRANSTLFQVGLCACGRQTTFQPLTKSQRSLPGVKVQVDWHACASCRGMFLTWHWMAASCPRSLHCLYGCLYPGLHLHCQAHCRHLHHHQALSPRLAGCPKQIGAKLSVSG